MGGAFQSGVFGAAILFGALGAAVVIGVSGALPNHFPSSPAAELELDAVERDFALLPSPIDSGGGDFGAAAGGPAGGLPHFH